MLRRFVLALFVLLALACSAPSGEVSDISQQEVVSAEPGEMLILDVRNPLEFDTGHVPGAINIPHDQVATRLAELEAGRDLPVVVYCERGGRAGKATAVLAGAGFEDVRHLEGDMTGWRAAKLPVEK